MVAYLFVTKIITASIPSHQHKRLSRVDSSLERQVKLLPLRIRQVPLNRLLDLGGEGLIGEETILQDLIWNRMTIVKAGTEVRT